MQKTGICVIKKFVHVLYLTRFTYSKCNLNNINIKEYLILEFDKNTYVYIFFTKYL